MILALAVWLGGELFFGAVLAPTAFSTLPNAALAGAVVGTALKRLHWIGLICGVVYLVTSLLLFRVGPLTGSAPAGLLRNLLAVAMLALTLTSQVAIIPRMDQLRSSMEQGGATVTQIPTNDARRVSFDSLHRLSTRLEGGVMLLGLVLLYLTTRIPA